MDADRQAEASVDEGRTQQGCARTCAVTRAVHSTDDLIRFVVDPQGAVVPDVARRLPGRGVWVSCSRDIVGQAVKRNVFARSLKRPAAADDHLPQRVEALLLRRCSDALALANKAGQVVAGFAKVHEMVGRGDCAVLVHASDASDDGVGKLDAKLYAVSRVQGAPVRIIRALPSDELSLAIGRPFVVHAALARGGAAEKFLREAGRLQRYRDDRDGAVSNQPSLAPKADE